jgi:tRNA threonylcarbamoyladenosine biosynthesis protein TsaE
LRAMKSTSPLACSGEESRYTGPSTSMAAQEFITHSAEETVALGRSLAEMLAPPKLVLLRGDLGAGKTTLVKGVAEAFHAASADDVTSPTFTLVHEYRGPEVNLYHIDLYRVDTPRQLETLGLDDLIADNSILLIEWGEKFARFEHERDVEIALARVEAEAGEQIGDRFSENDRRIRIITS